MSVKLWFVSGEDVDTSELHFAVRWETVCVQLPDLPRKVGYALLFLFQRESVRQRLRYVTILHTIKNLLSSTKSYLLQIFYGPLQHKRFEVKTTINPKQWNINLYKIYTRVQLQFNLLFGTSVFIVHIFRCTCYLPIIFIVVQSYDSVVILRDFFYAFFNCF